MHHADTFVAPDTAVMSTSCSVVTIKEFVIVSTRAEPFTHSTHDSISVYTALLVGSRGACPGSGLLAVSRINLLGVFRRVTPIARHFAVFLVEDNAQLFACAIMYTESPLATH